MNPDKNHNRKLIEDQNELIEEQTELIDDPAGVVSATDCTGLFPAMAGSQDEALAMEDIVHTHPVVVPKLGGDSKRKE